MADIEKLHENIKKFKMIKNDIVEFKSNQLFQEDRVSSLLKELLTKEYKSTDETQHELTRRHITDRFDDFDKKIATKDEIIKSKEEIIETIKKESHEAQEKLLGEIKELKDLLLRFLPHRRAFRLSVYFSVLFLFFLFSELLFNIQIINKFWGSLGLFVSGGFLIMSYFLFLDWKGK